MYNQAVGFIEDIIKMPNGKEVTSRTINKARKFLLVKIVKLKKSNKEKIKELKMRIRKVVIFTSLVTKIDIMA
jgi:hypothetical protein